MKNIFQKIFIIVLLISCAPTTQTVEVNPTETFDTPVPATNTPFPTQINTATPTQTLAPIVPVPIEPHPMALNEFNAGTEMKLLNTFGTGTPYDIKFSPDGSLLAIATGRGVYFYDGETFEEVSFLDLNDSVSAIAFNPNGETIALAIEGKTSIWNIKSGQKLMDLPDEMVNVYELAYGVNGHVAAIGGDCRSCGSAVDAMILWDLLTQDKIYEERSIPYASNVVGFTSDGKTLFFGGKEGLTNINIDSMSINVFKNTIGVTSAINYPSDFVLDEVSQKIYLLSPHGDNNTVINLIDNSQEVFNTCDTTYYYLIKSDSLGGCINREEIVLFDLASGNKISNIKTSAKINVAKNLTAINPEGNLLAISNAEGFEIINLPSRKSITQITINNSYFSQSGIIEVNEKALYVVATYNYSNKINIINVETGQIIRFLQHEGYEINDFAFAPDGKTGATIINNNILSIWDIKLQKVIDEIVIDKGYLFRLVFSPEGAKIFVTNHEKEIFEVDLQTKSVTKIGDRFVGGNSPLTANDFQFTKDNKIILFGIRNKTIYFTEIFQDEKLLIPFLEPYVLETFAIDNANQYLAVGMPNSILIWDLQNNNLLQKLDEHEKRYGDGWIGAINHLLFAPNSNLLASVGFDGTTRLWNAKAGTELRILNVCCSASFTPDGRYFVTAGDGVIRVWGIP